jgi:murein DD-endopeptidase MepM/ murein hydrolase activator NlpD
VVPRSVTVRVGDRVVRGQVLGRVGNSGNSSAPHLHMHVMASNQLFAANGLPYVFDAFDVTGRIASTDAFNRAEATGEPARLGPVRTGPRRNELTMDQLIVTWPGRDRRDRASDRGRGLSRSRRRAHGPHRPRGVPPLLPVHPHQPTARTKKACKCSPSQKRLMGFEPMKVVG